MFSCLFQLLDLHSLHSLGHSTFFCLESQQCIFKSISALSLHHLLFCLCSQISLCLLLIRTLVIIFRDHQDNFLISRSFITFAKSLLSYREYSQVPGIRIWISLGLSFNLPQILFNYLFISNSFVLLLPLLPCFQQLIFSFVIIHM